MEPSVIEQVRSNAVIRALIAGWPRVVERGITKQDEDAVLAGSNLLAIGTLRTWAQFSGCSELDVVTWAPFLFAHRIVSADGADPMATAIVARIGIAGLPKDLREQLLGAKKEET